MNTPAHVIVSALVVGRGPYRHLWLPVTLGAVLPDLPMVFFYAFERSLGTSEQIIWSERYFDLDWQAFFDAFNSLPLIAAAAALAWWRGSRFSLALLASMAVHAVCDLLVHREDAHAHFEPLTSWRFMSPVSYWDPAHHGAVFLAFELVLILAGSVVLMRRPDTGWRAVGACTLATAVAFGGFAAMTWA